MFCVGGAHGLGAAGGQARGGGHAARTAHAGRRPLAAGGAPGAAARRGRLRPDRQHGVRDQPAAHAGRRTQIAAAVAGDGAGAVRRRRLAPRRARRPLGHRYRANATMPLTMSRAAVVRVLPFAAYMALLGLRGAAPADGSWGIDPRWIYGVTVLVVGGLLLAFRRDYGELSRQTLPEARQALLAAGVGLVVFVLWVNLDAPWMTLGEATAGFVPLRPDGSLDGPLIVVRWIGATLVVPVMEELFWRSFLMRWIRQPAFLGVEPARVGARAVVISTFLFVLAHPLWLAAAIAGLAYALLYITTGRLWTAVIAHAVTNGALGLWVVWTRDWGFW